jgi:hypothetical protein
MAIRWQLSLSWQVMIAVRSVSVASTQTFFPWHSEAEHSCRLLLACLVLAIKFVEDQVFTNSFYAKAGGVSASVLQEMEIYAYVSLEYLLHVTVAELEAALKEVTVNYPPGRALFHETVTFQ